MFTVLKVKSVQDSSGMWIEVDRQYAAKPVGAATIANLPWATSRELAHTMNRATAGAWARKLAVRNQGDGYTYFVAGGSLPFEPSK
jgi:hypothetical protein